MKELYLALLLQLKTSVPELKWIDLDSGQLNASERPPLAYPAALVKINYPSTTKIGGGKQYADVQLTLRLVFDATGSRTSAAIDTAIITNSLAWLDTTDKVYTALQGWKQIDTLYNESEPFECTSRGQESPRSDGLIVFSLTFTSSE